LVGGAASTEGGNEILRAGIEIRLDPGWKTYWRYPGDSGVPPHFDFARSQNVESVQVLWPAPRSFDDGDGRSIGYKEGVILPLRILARDRRRPATLRLDITYAICDKLCVPAEGRAELVLPIAASSHEQALKSSEARVPRPVPIGPGQPLAIAAVTGEAGAAHPRILVDVNAPDGASVELFAEGPNPDWALPLPQAVAAPAPAPGLHRFAFDLDGLPPGASATGAVIKLTAISGDKAIEVEAKLE